MVAGMKIFYGWVIVGAGIVITCLGMGTMMSLGIFLQPMSAATGWSRTSISTAALLNFLCMGPASFLWGALSDRFGTRAVVFSGTRDLAGFYGLALMFGFSYGAVMPLYAILVREYFGARIMGTMFGAVNMASTLGMALGPWAGGWLYDAYGSYFWLYIGSFGIGLGAVAIAFAFRPSREFSLALPSSSLIQGA